MYSLEYTEYCAVELRRFYFILYSYKFLRKTVCKKKKPNMYKELHWIIQRTSMSNQCPVISCPQWPQLSLLNGNSANAHEMSEIDCVKVIIKYYKTQFSHAVNCWMFKKKIFYISQRGKLQVGQFLQTRTAIMT